MNLSFLERHEQFLAHLWSWWSHTTRVIKIFVFTTPNQYQSLLRILTMLRNQRKFLSTNNPKFLSKALEEYFIIRDLWHNTLRFGTGTKATYSGWAFDGGLQTLRKMNPVTRIRRIFRPDVWYLTRGKSGFFAGFEFVDKLDTVKELYRTIKEPELVEIRNSEDSKLPTLKFESINPSRSQRATHWYSSFALSPKTLTQLIEYASDSEMASIISEVYADIPEDLISTEVERSILTLQLIAKRTELQNNKWTRFSISEPDWILTNEASETAQTRLSEKYFVANDVEVLNGGVVLSHGNFVNWDPSQHPSLDFVAGNLEHVVGSMGNLNECFIRNLPSGKSFREAIILGSRVDTNWFHFLIETLPRLIVLENIAPAHVPVLVSNRLPSTAVEALRSITGRSIEFMDTQSVSSVSRAYVSGPVIYHPDSQFLWDRETGQEVNIELLKQLRERILANRTHRILPVKTYFERTSNHRGLINPKSISKLAIKRGYTLTDPAKLSFDEQVTLFQQSREILTVGGAVMANFIFANKETKITLLVSNFIEDYRMPLMMAAVSGSEVRVIGGTPLWTLNRYSYLHKIHASFFISPRNLKSSI
jgi:hypothetical protein